MILCKILCPRFYKSLQRNSIGIHRFPKRWPWIWTSSASLFCHLQIRHHAFKFYKQGSCWCSYALTQILTACFPWCPKQFLCQHQLQCWEGVVFWALLHSAFVVWHWSQYRAWRQRSMCETLWPNKCECYRSVRQVKTMNYCLRPFCSYLQWRYFLCCPFYFSFEFVGTAFHFLFNI